LTGAPRIGDEAPARYITTARTGLGDAALARTPEAGGLFACRPDVRGIADARFAG